MRTLGALSRRRAMHFAGAVGALPLVHIRSAGAAGKLSLAFWDHWVPGGNDAMTRQINAWAQQNKTKQIVSVMIRDTKSPQRSNTQVRAIIPQRNG